MSGSAKGVTGDTSAMDLGHLTPHRVRLSSLRASPNSRPINNARVDELATSIRQIGLIHLPVIRPLVPPGEWFPSLTLKRDPKKIMFEIVSGHHRIEACRKLGCTEIIAVVMDDDDLVAQLRQIDENLCRHDLSPAERAMAVTRRKAIYQQLHPITVHGASKGDDGKFQPSRQLGDTVERFTKATSEATGTAERTIQRDAARGEKLGDDVLKKVAGTSLDKGEELDALAKLSPARRDSLVERAAAGDTVTAKTAAKQPAVPAPERTESESCAEQEEPVTSTAPPDGPMRGMARFIIGAARIQDWIKNLINIEKGLPRELDELVRTMSPYQRKVALKDADRCIAVIEIWRDAMLREEASKLSPDDDEGAVQMRAVMEGAPL
jgi:hypothetical protein